MRFSHQTISQTLIGTKEKDLLSYINHLNVVAQKGGYDFLESFINLPFDEELLRDVEKLKSKKVSPKLKYIINIGIGGSSLGAKAIYDALYGHFDVLEPNRFPKMIFLDTVDPEFLNNLLIFLKKKVSNPEEILVLLISKSGTNTEPLANFEIIYPTLKNKFININSRIVAITGHKSKLWDQAQEKGIEMISLPKLVGGRYSVFSAVGLFPLASAGIDIKSLVAGAQKVRALCLSGKLEENPAAASAFLLFHNFKNGKTINDNFVFHPELESLGKWYRQLMGESIGKEKDVDDNIVNIGITPTVSIGSTDLHSVGQLYLGGPKDKFTTFIYTKYSSKKSRAPQGLFLSGLVDNISGKSASDIMDAILEGVKIAYSKRGLPFVEVVLESISEKSLGEFLQYKMMEMIFLGKLMDVNPFDQPNVESYKVETKRILASQNK